MVRREFLINDQGVKSICRYYGGEDHWRKCYNDIWKWNQTDPEFREAYSSYKRKMGKEDGIGGRPKLDAEDPEWKQRFCEAYIKFRNPKKAASVTPYSFSTIMRKMDRDDSSYDEELAKMFKLAQLDLAADTEEIAMNAVFTFNDPTIDQETAKIADIQSRVALNTLGKINSERFGKKLEVSGKIDVSHQHSIAGRSSTLASLMEEQRQMLADKGKSIPLALPSPREELDNVLEAEFVVVEERSNAISG